jgi:hypothetical protein
VVTRGRLRLKCDGTLQETRFRLSVKRKSRGVSISGSNAGYTMFQGSVKSTGYPLHLPVSPSLPLLCVTVGHHISTGLLTCTPTIQPQLFFHIQNLSYTHHEGNGKSRVIAPLILNLGTGWR